MVMLKTVRNPPIYKKEKDTVHKSHPLCVGGRENVWKEIQASTQRTSGKSVSCVFQRSSYVLLLMKYVKPGVNIPAIYLDFCRFLLASFYLSQLF